MPRFSWEEASHVFNNRFAIIKDVLYYTDMTWRGRVHLLFTDYGDAIDCCTQLADQPHNLMLVCGEDVICDSQMFTSEQVRAVFPNSFTVIKQYMRRENGERRGFISCIASEDEARRYTEWCIRQNYGSACCTRGNNLR